MSEPRPPEPVKLIASLFSREEEKIIQVIDKMKETFGPVDWISPRLYFERTRYYEREMGWPLVRRFISFEELIDPGALPDIKLLTNQLEKELCSNGKRVVNIDPGYIALERLVLATGKNYTHRVYLNKGIYADLTLIYSKGSFEPLKWTYPDYADRTTIQMFNRIRERYKEQLRGRPCLEV